MAGVHLIFGLLLLVVFLITGQYMRADFPDNDAIDQTLRILMRSRHIYILFASLINIGLGIYFVSRTAASRRYLQYAGSAILVLSSILLVAAFVYETYTLAAYSELSRLGIYTSLAGIGFHLIAALGDRNFIASHR